MKTSSHCSNTILLIVFVCLAGAVGCARSKGARISKVCFTGTEGVELQVTMDQQSDYTGTSHDSFHAVVPMERMMMGSTIQSVHVLKISTSGDVNMTIFSNEAIAFQGSASGTNREIRYDAK